MPDQEEYHLIGPPPCTTLNFVRIGEEYFLVIFMEPFWATLPTPAGGFNTQIYPITTLPPSGNGYIQMVQKWGIQGNLQVLIEYQAGTPRFNSTNQTRLRLDRFQAPYLNPATAKFIIMLNDTISADVVAGFPGVLGTIWFYGWKMQLAKVNRSDLENKSYILLEDVRQLGVLPTNIAEAR